MICSGSRAEISARLLRTVPPFVSAHTFCASRDIEVSYLPTTTTTFCVAYDYVDVEKADLNKGYQNPKRRVTTNFSEIIELKFGKKLPYILCILALLWNYGCLTYQEMVYCTGSNSHKQ